MLLFPAPNIKALMTARSAHGINSQLPTFEAYVRDVLHICPSLPEIDLPVNIPTNAHFVGPIILPEHPLSQSNPKLLAWLQRGPTVLVNLGTHQEGNADQARGQAMGLRILLNARPDVQILWKFRAAKNSRASEEIEAFLGAEIGEDKVRVVNWLESDPLAILQSGCIDIAVHHGGANSWFEATW
ncbi:UDP-Glycosyltransferase/glycogen phosphorylase [Microthyrium microscopicum]|uniref:UDP-Glycosyltransferase/glycogen phosphorylase n=1 Tax=Microthyrium microscopicum TaxID=703497 RepID=A0A6A6UCS0_9PEZI|nr:UDP-Glycosyltransferase/glycogen phosphorylase [Microthyrium microscopicum]